MLQASITDFSSHVAVDRLILTNTDLGVTLRDKSIFLESRVHLVANYALLHHKNNLRKGNVTIKMLVLVFGTGTLLCYYVHYSVCKGLEFGGRAASFRYLTVLCTSSSLSLAILIQHFE